MWSLWAAPLPTTTAALPPVHISSSGGECDDLPSRVQQGLVGALGDAWNPGDGNEILEEACSPLGLELLQALRAVAVSGFEFRRCANAWRTWAEYAHESEPDRGWSPAARQALLQLQRGAAPEDVAGHHVDLEAAARLPALLLLAEHVDDDGLAMASHEMQRITHENPKALQAGEFFLRSALALLRAPCRGAMAMAAALRAAAAPRLPGLPGCGSGLQALVEEVLSEVQSREAVRAQLGDLTGPLAAFHSDAEVLGRLTSSGGAPGDEVNSAKTSFAIPAILWFVLAYETADAALHASSALGGDGQWSRAFFVGLLLGCRDGVPGAKEVQLPRFQPFAGPALQLCRKPGNCQSSSRSLDGVVVDAALAEEPCPGLCYRIFMRFNASSLLQSRAERLTMPPDWDEERKTVPGFQMLERHV
ncbi:unnamed protein product [Effrenium voratum]|nr:unnamed protein product [Effrenium voratum]